MYAYVCTCKCINLRSRFNLNLTHVFFFHSQNNIGFWQYEYNKHGTCALPALGSQENFFNTTLYLNNLYEPNEALASAGINPEEIDELSLYDLKDVFQDAWGADVLIVCDSEK